MTDADAILQAVEALIQEYLKNGRVEREAYNHIDETLQNYFTELRKKDAEGREITPRNCWLAAQLDVDRTFRGGDNVRYGNAGDILTDSLATFEN